MSFNLEFVQKHAKAMRACEACGFLQEAAWHKKMIALDAQLISCSAMSQWPVWGDEVVRGFLEKIDV